MDPIIQGENIVRTFAYGIYGINFSVDEGEVFGVLGPNGSVDHTCPAEMVS